MNLVCHLSRSSCVYFLVCFTASMILQEAEDDNRSLRGSMVPGMSGHLDSKMSSRGQGDLEEARIPLFTTLHCSHAWPGCSLRFTEIHLFVCLFA